MNFPCIALLTDFGERDGFAGVMKGVMLSRLIQPVPLVDISHQVERQNIRQAMEVLESAYRYFPPKTVFVSVVDPGVGHANQALLLCFWPEREQAFLAPDNGLLTPIFEAAGQTLQVYDLRRSEDYREDRLSLHGRSATFYGRDVYAPTAASLANAFLTNAMAPLLATLGQPITQVVRQTRLQASREETEPGLWRINGEIIRVDIYGNLITNIPQDWLSEGSSLSVSIAENTSVACPFLAAYSATDRSGKLIAVPSSNGTIELAVFLGSAQNITQASPGDPVIIQAEFPPKACPPARINRIKKI